MTQHVLKQLSLFSTEWRRAGVTQECVLYCTILDIQCNEHILFCLRSMGSPILDVCGVRKESTLVVAKKQIAGRVTGVKA
jgi:hypothetical protein